MLCPHCHKAVDLVDAYEDEAPTGKSAVAMRLYRLWLGAFDWFTVEQQQILLDVAGVLKDLAPADFARLTRAITGPGLRRILGKSPPC